VPNRIIINGTASPVTVGANTVGAEKAAVVNVATDADLASWINTPGVAALDATTSYNRRRVAALRLAHAISGAPS
jgi:hypothetical protein